MPFGTKSPISSNGVSLLFYLDSRNINSETPLNVALQTLELRNQQGFPVSRNIIYHLLQACTKKKDLAASRRLHSLMVSSGLDFVSILRDHLIRLFAICGSLVEANQIFCKGTKVSVYTWNAIIAAHVMLGECQKALELYHKMQLDALMPDRVTFLCILKACTNMGVAWQGRLGHDQILRNGYELDSIVGNTLICMYNKFDGSEDAWRVFDNLPDRDVVSWDVMISGCVQLGDYLSAFELFMKMHQNGIDPDRVTFLCLLKACSYTEFTGQGKILHDWIIKSAFDSDVVIGNALVDLYAKGGSMEEACKMFENIPVKDIVSWGAILVGFVENEHYFLALEQFKKMQQEGVLPSKVTYLCSLKACGCLGDISQGRLIHDQIIVSGLELNELIGSTLLNMYCKCGSLAEACKLFEILPNQDVVSWGSMISGYVQQGYCHAALETFEKMQQEGMVPNSVIFLCSLKACSSVGEKEQGRLIHDQITRSGFDMDMTVGNAVVDMYVKCESLDEAYMVFDKLPCQDAVSWGAIISGYAKHGHSCTAFELFGKMQQYGIDPDRATFLCILKACNDSGVVDQGRLLHYQIVECGFDFDCAIGNTLLDMYAKCGSMEDALTVFKKLAKQDDVSWAAIIAGFAQSGHCSLAQQCFKDGQQQGLKPNDVTFLNILTACSHGGLLAEGCWYLNSMREDHGIVPSIEHYCCLVDLLCRAGYLNESADLLETMPVPPDIIVWTSLLTSCRTFGNVKLGRQIFNRIVQFYPKDASGYVLMSNVCASAHLWEDFDKILELRR